MPTSRNHMTRLSAACAALGVAAAVHADCTDGYDFIIRVDDDAPAGGDGCSWETAFNDLQDALDAAYNAPNGWHIRVRIADGVYTPGLGQRTDSFVIDTPRRQSGVWLQITGAFAGLADPENPDTHDPNRFTSVLSGDHLGNDGPDQASRDDNAYHVIRIPSGGYGALSIEHVTISSGAAEDDLQNDRGGALSIQPDSYAVFTGCVFADNSASYGGAIGAQSAWAYDDPAFVMSFTRCRFERNSAVEAGGAAISLGLGGMYFINSTFVANHAAYGGAIEQWSIPSVFGCEFIGNHAEFVGGAIRSHHNSPSIVNCTFVENSTGSTAPAVSLGGFQNVPVLANCIFWDNRGPNGSVDVDPVWAEYGTYDIAHSCVQHTEPGPTSINADPLFVDPVGPDGVAGTGDEDYGLRSESLCIDLGSMSLVNATGVRLDLYQPFPLYYPLDPLGEPRVIGADIDAGAFEFQAGDIKCGVGDVTTAVWLFSGIPDGFVTGADVQLFVYAWQRYIELADVNTAGVPSGDPAYGTPDGRFTGADLQYFVNHWLQGCD